MGNDNVVENSTTIANEIAANVNIDTSQSCWTSNGAINVINFACQPSAEAIENIANGFNACIAIAGPGACDRFYVALIDTQLCKFQSISQTITYQLVTNCNLDSKQAAVINTDMINSIAQELDTVDDLGAVIFGAFSKKNTNNIINLTNTIQQGFDISTHQESYQTATVSNVLDISGTGQQANSISQEAKFDATFNAYMQSDTVSDMANTINNQTDQVLTAKTSGLFTAAEAWAEAFGSMGTAFLIGIIVAITVVVLIILIVPIVTLLPKGGSSKTVETIVQSEEARDFAAQALLGSSVSNPLLLTDQSGAGNVPALLPPPQQVPVTPTFADLSQVPEVD